jgi:hypothetical protein
MRQAGLKFGEIMMVRNKRGQGERGEGFTDQEKKIGQELLSMVPELPKMLGRLTDRIEHFDVRQPKTFIAATKNDFDVLVNRLQGREQRVARLLWRLFGKLAFKIVAKPMLLEAIALTKREASIDPRYSLLLKLMHKADEAIPLISMIVSVRHADPESALLPQCAPLAFLQQAERERGEARAASVLDALRATSEFVYKPYLVTIWCLCYLKEREIPPAKVPDFGELVKQAHHRLREFPGLVETDAGWMRNSAVHHLPNYILEEDALIMEAKNVQPVKVRVDDLLALVQRMYRISAVTIHRVGQLYMLRDLYLNTGLFDVFIEHIPHIYAGDEKRVAVAEQELMEYVKTLLEPLKEFFDSHS